MSGDLAAAAGTKHLLPLPSPFSVVKAGAQALRFTNLVILPQAVSTRQSPARLRKC